MLYTKIIFHIAKKVIVKRQCCSMKQYDIEFSTSTQKCNLRWKTNFDFKMKIYYMDIHHDFRCYYENIILIRTMGGKSI